MQKSTSDSGGLAGAEGGEEVALGGGEGELGGGDGGEVLLDKGEEGEEGLLEGGEIVAVGGLEEFVFEGFGGVDHLEAYVRQTTAKISEWRFGPKPYVPERDRGALELYARYHGTPQGIRLLNHRWVFALRRGDPLRYPVDAMEV